MVTRARRSNESLTVAPRRIETIVRNVFSRRDVRRGVERAEFPSGVRVGVDRGQPREARGRGVARATASESSDDGGFGGRDENRARFARSTRSSSDTRETPSSPNAVRPVLEHRAWFSIAARSSRGVPTRRRPRERNAREVTHVCSPRRSARPCSSSETCSSRGRRPPARARTSPWHAWARARTRRGPRSRGAGSCASAGEPAAPPGRDQVIDGLPRLHRASLLACLRGWVALDAARSAVIARRERTGVTRD